MFQLADIRRLLDAFERSDWDEVHLVAEGVELHIAGGATTTVSEELFRPAQELVTADAPAPGEPPFVEVGPSLRRPRHLVINRPGVQLTLRRNQHGD